jgi:hypothetical protein
MKRNNNRETILIFTTNLETGVSHLTRDNYLKSIFFTLSVEARKNFLRLHLRFLVKIISFLKNEVSTVSTIFPPNFFWNISPKRTSLFDLGYSSIRSRTVKLLLFNRQNKLLVWQQETKRIFMMNTQKEPSRPTYDAK